MLTNAAPNSALPTARELVSLTVPQLGMMLCHLAVSMTDLWVAGRLDASVQASLGIVSQVFTLLMLITSLAGSGCLTTISQALGAGLEQRARRYAALIAGLAGLTGTAIAATSLLCLPMTLRLMHVSPEMEPVVRTFIIAYSCQLPFYYTLIMLNSVFRAYKLVRLPLIAIAVVAVGNLIGSAGFGLGLCGLPDYGYPGDRVEYLWVRPDRAGLQPVRHRPARHPEPRVPRPVAVGPACHALSLPGGRHRPPSALWRDTWGISSSCRCSRGCPATWCLSLPG